MVRLFLLLLGCLLLPIQVLAQGPRVSPEQGKAEGDLVWYDVRKLGVEGQGWQKVAAPFDRLPASAEKLVRNEVWNLSRQSAGLCVRFQSDATHIEARWTLTGKNLAMPHMPATAVSGLDLYVREGSGKWQWLGVGIPRAVHATATLTRGLTAGKTREFLLYLPLYNGVSSVEIGLSPDAKLYKPLPYPAYKKPIVFYGTSITQGGCASRPGMVHTALLGRMLDWPVINLGFSGNGRMELEIAQLLGELDAAAYVLDCLPNMTAVEVEKRVEPFVLALRKARSQTPILLVEDRSYTNSGMLPQQRKRNTSSRAALRHVYDKMVAEGVASIHYQPGDSLLGEDGEGTVDGSHPNDLGFMRQAQVLLPMMKYVLPGPEVPRPVIEAYATELAYNPGQEALLCVSCSAARYSVEVARIGAKREVVWQKTDLVGKHQVIVANASSHGAGWKANLAVPVGRDWKAGYYAVQLEANLPGGKRATSETFFVVRGAKQVVRGGARKAAILLVLSTNTYNAYSNWGGYSLYAYNGKNRVQGRRVSFDRPLSSQYANWEQHFVAWAERSGYELDFAVNSDLDREETLVHSVSAKAPVRLCQHQLVVSVGHDEYWSSSMRDNLEKHINLGGNVAFLSGNTCCWQVRPEEEGRALVCYKQAYKADPVYRTKDHRLLSTLWSHHLLRRPENALTGVGFLFGGYHLSHGQFMNGSGAFTVHQPKHWLFAGTDLRQGDSFGGKDTIVGYECDGCELTWKDGIPRPTYRDGTPKGFEVLATAPARWHPDDCEWYEQWEKGRTGNAVIGIYRRGGTVVTVGTTDWSHGLRGKDPVVERITRNILDKLSR